MDSRAIIQFSMVRENRLYTFSVPMGAAYTETFEVLDEMRKNIEKIQEENIKKAQEQEQQSDPVTS